MSSILTNSARKKFAELLRGSTLHMAWGTGVASWGTDVEITQSFPNDNLLNMAHSYIGSVVVRPAPSGDPYAVGTDYTVNLNTGVISRLVGGTIPANQSVKVNYHVNPAPASTTATDLIAEVGRRVISSKQYAVPDSEGAIEVETGKFSLSPGNAITNHLLLEVAFLPSEAPTAQIKELGVFSDTIRVDGVSGALEYLLPNQVLSKGTLITAHNLATIVRNNTSRETFRLVITL